MYFAGFGLEVDSVSLNTINEFVLGLGLQLRLVSWLVLVAGLV